MIECKAIPGSILISSKVHDEVKNQSDIQAQFLNACQFEGIEKPIDVYAISNSGLVVPDLPEPVASRRPLSKFQLSKFF